MKHIFIFFTILFSTSLYSQTFEYDYKENKWITQEDKSFPFDIPFKIRILNLDKKINSASIRVNNYSENKHYRFSSSYFNCGNGQCSIDVEDNKLNIPRLHANENYIISINSYDNYIFSERDLNTIKNSIVGQFQRTFNEEMYDPTSIKRMHNSITNQLTSLNTKTLYIINEGNYKPLTNLFDDYEPYNNLVNEYAINQSNYQEAKKRICISESTKKSSISSTLSKYITFLNDLTSGNMNLKEGFKDHKIYKHIISKDLEKMKNSTERDRINHCDIDVEEDLRFHKVIAGKGTIGVSGFNNLTNHSFDTILLEDLKNYFEIFFSNATSDLISRLDIHINNINDFEQAKSVLEEKLKAETIKNSLNSFFVKDDFFLTLDTDVIINTAASPYFGLDFGYLYGFTDETLMSYQGVNIHFVPVNRSVVSKHYKKQDLFLKKFSIYAGFSRILDDNSSTDKEYKNLLGVGNLVVGTGYRFNRVLRLNGGYTFYLKENDNPTITTYVHRNSAFLGISADLNLKNTFTNSIK